jgi:hypothetical protein
MPTEVETSPIVENGLLLLSTALPDGESSLDFARDDRKIVADTWARHDLCGNRAVPAGQEGDLSRRSWLECRLVQNGSRQERSPCCAAECAE